MDDICKRSLKIAILGARKSGKTAVTVRFLTGKFIFEYASGHDIVYKHNFLAASTHVPLQITDTSCNENPADAISGCDGMVVVYAIDSVKSFQRAQEILSDVTKEEGKEPCVALVANKSDLWPHKLVEPAEGKELADKYHCNYFEMSALSCKDGVCDMFKSVIHLAVEKRKVRSFSLPTYTEPILTHDEIKRTHSLQFPKKESKPNGQVKSKSLSKSISLASTIPEVKQNTNSKSKSRTNSESLQGKCDNGNIKLDGSVNNISKIFQRTLGDMGSISQEAKPTTNKSRIIHKTLGDMGHIAFSAIAFPMSMNPRELKT